VIEFDARPFGFRFEPAHAALAIIDMQRDFVEPGGFGETLGRRRRSSTAATPTSSACRRRPGCALQAAERSCRRTSA